ncbi:MAG: hypothetical protein LUC86_06225 [Prevotellaceae bacterium]|nr:hypothetical protein [Prevotellaceae bacterium]
MTTDELGIPYIAWMNKQSNYWLDVKAIAEREENEQKAQEYHSAAPSGLTLAT